MGNISNYLFLILGWGLGLLSNLIFDYYKRTQKKSEIKKGILNEIKVIRKILLANIYSLTLKFSILNRDILNMLYENIYDFSDEDGFEKFKKIIEKYLKLSDTELEQISSEYRKTKKFDAVNLKLIKYPYIDINFGNIPLFEEDLQQFLIKFVTFVSQLNEEILQSKFYYEKTFDISIGEQNHEIIKINLLNTYQFVIRKSFDIISLINKKIG